MKGTIQMCEKKINVPALFGEMVFGEQQMQQRLPADVYLSLIQIS